MSSADETLTIEMIRWTFAVDPAHRGEIETYLLDQGLEVLVRGEETMVATWDEPEGSIEEVIEGMWAIAGSPFEVTHEEFHRANLLLYDADEETKAVA
ncbi:hypothetical protein [Paludisphaera soli]|uniref:hypothetical protein n=1 Tax=Paludisphaera soli TaxID=2712865 RepID=UPI0013EAD43C|nr:hypothetical protein [Paludisphaera soli]